MAGFKSSTCSTVLIPGRAEDIKHQGATGSGAKAVGHTARCLPEISHGNPVLNTILDANPTSLEQYSPLFLRVTVYLARPVRGDTNDRQHHILAREDP